MDNVVWWATTVPVIAAAAVDIRSRRIPNWLTVPFLLAGLLVSLVFNGISGLAGSLEGIAVAVLALGVFVWLGGLGMGDLKLFAAVGAWIGPSHLFLALIVTSIIGGAMALLQAARLRTAPGKTGAGSIPYAPAIAAGTIFSLFAS